MTKKWLSYGDKNYPEYIHGSTQTITPEMLKELYIKLNELEDYLLDNFDPIQLKGMDLYNPFNGAKQTIRLDMSGRLFRRWLKE